MLDKEELQNRIIKINEELVTTRSNVIKLEGHLGEAHHWLATLYKAESAEQPPLTEEPIDLCKEQEDGQVDEQSQE